MATYFQNFIGIQNFSVNSPALAANGFSASPLLHTVPNDEYWIFSVLSYNVFTTVNKITFTNFFPTGSSTGLSNAFPVGNTSLRLVYPVKWPLFNVTIHPNSFTTTENFLPGFTTGIFIPNSEVYIAWHGLSGATVSATLNYAAIKFKNRNV